MARSSRHRLARVPPRLGTKALLVLAAGAVLAMAQAAGAGDRGADGRYDRRDSPHFSLHQDVDLDRSSGWRGSVRFEREVLGVLEGAYDALDVRLGLRPPRRLAVWIHDPARFDAQFAGLFAFGVAGFYGGTIQVRGDVAVTAPLARTLHHELLHAALDAAAPSLVAPAWWNEGLAEWFAARVAGQRHPTAGEWGALARAERSGGWLPVEALSGATFAGLPGDRAPLAYLQSRALVDHLVRRSGEASLQRTLDIWMRTRSLDRALERVHRLSARDLDAALRMELR